MYISFADIMREFKRPLEYKVQQAVEAIGMDPFGGSGTVSVVAQRHGRSSTYIDINPDYRQMAVERLRPGQPSLTQPFEIALVEGSTTDKGVGPWHSECRPGS